MKRNYIAFDLTPMEFLAIYSVLQHVRLGSRNEYEDAISDLMINIGIANKGAILEDVMKDAGVSSLPDISIEASNNDGVVINIVK